jgi:hypothetical protein
MPSGTVITGNCLIAPGQHDGGSHANHPAEGQDVHEASEERLNGHAAPPERPITPPATTRRPAGDKAER